MVGTLGSLAVAALLASAAPAPANPLTPAGSADAIREAAVVVRTMAEACERLDADAATRDFLLTPETIVVGSDGEVADPTQYRDGVRAFYGSLSRLHFVTIREEFRALAPETVLYVWSYKVEGTSKAGGPWVVDSETASFLLRKIDGAWKFVFFQESAVPLRRLPVAHPP